MSKGLKELKRVVEWFEIENVKDIEIIEKELKDYEEMKAIKGTITLDNALEETLIKACPNVAKKLKALEIIKEKQVNVGNIIHDIEEHGLTYQEYLECYDYYQYGGTQLTQEEFDLLKEVLL